MSRAPSFGNRTFAVSAEIERANAEQEGCIVTFGDSRSGFALYLLRDRLVFDYNMFGQHLKAISDKPVPAGKTTVGVAVERPGPVRRAPVWICARPRCHLVLPL